MGTESNSPRHVAFEEFKKSDPTAHPIATVWRHSPEYFAWQEVIQSQGEEVVKAFDDTTDSPVVTFYRTLTATEQQAQATRAEEESLTIFDAGAPAAYEVLKVVHEHDDGTETHKVSHVKLGTPRYVPFPDGRYGLCEYVFVDQYKNVLVDPQDETNSFEFLCTRVHVTDEEAGDYEGVDTIYTAPSFLDVWEVMFAIGEYPILKD